MHRKRSVSWGRLVALLVVLLVLGGGAYAYYVYRNPGVVIPAATRHQGRFKGRFTVLLLGEGLIQDGNRDIISSTAPDQSDSMMLLSIDPTTDQANVLSIPRDSEVHLPGTVGLNKINDANFLRGPQFAAEVVSHLLHVPVDYYLETTMYNFPSIVNILGGLTVDVPYPMVYGTATGAGAKYNIDLHPGVQHLDGLQVLQMVRFRNTPLGDIGRIQNQQYVIGLIVKKALSPSEITHLPTIISLLRQDITHTNLTDTEMLALAAIGRHINLADVRYGTLPGEGQTINGIDYWKLNTRLLPVVVDNVLLDRLTPADKARLYIHVLSASNSLTNADKVAEWLRKQGFNVSPPVYSGQTLTQSVIDNYTDDKYLSAAIAAAMGGPSTTTVDNILYHTVPQVDMNIYVGSDLHLNPKAKV